MYCFWGCESDPTFRFNADSDPRQSDENLLPLVNRFSTAPSILSIHANIVSVQGPPWLVFEPLQLLNFDWSGSGSSFSLCCVPDPASKYNAISATLVASFFFLYPCYVWLPWIHVLIKEATWFFPVLPWIPSHRHVWNNHFFNFNFIELNFKYWILRVLQISLIGSFTF